MATIQRFVKGKLMEFRVPDYTVKPRRGKLKYTGPTEHDEQVALFNWIKTMMPTIPDLKWAYAVPNGGHRHMAVARKLKAEGVQAGVPDVEIPSASRGFTGLHIEMKRVKKSEWPLEQQEWKSGLEYVGRCVVVCKGFDVAKSVICWYFGKQEWTLPDRPEPKPFSPGRNALRFN